MQKILPLPRLQKALRSRRLLVGSGICLVASLVIATMGFRSADTIWLRAATFTPQVAGIASENPSRKIGHKLATSAAGENATSARATLTSHVGLVLDLYFERENSPLRGQGETFSRACRKYGAPADCLLLPAIAKVETDLCKAEGGISARQHNCWGFGGSGPNRILYPNFSTAIDEITRRLMSGYGYNFFRNPEIGELAYCGAHCNTWGEKVNSEISRINQFNISQGYPSLR